MPTLLDMLQLISARFYYCHCSNVIMIIWFIWLPEQEARPRARRSPSP